MTLLLLLLTKYKQPEEYFLMFVTTVFHPRNGLGNFLQTAAVAVTFLFLLPWNGLPSAQRDPGRK